MSQNETSRNINQRLQWLRHLQLMIGTTDGEWLDVSELRFTFRIEQQLQNKPTMAEFQIFNLSEATSQAIQKEGAPIVLVAGYPDNYGQIFRGTATQIHRGRQSGTDTYLTLSATSGDLAYNYAIANRTLSAGWRQQDSLAEVQRSMKEYGVGSGNTPETRDAPAARGKVMFGAARDYLNDFALATATEWTIIDDKLEAIPVRGLLPGIAIELGPTSGLIGMPTQSLTGVNVKSLLNPCLRVGGQIYLNSQILREDNPSRQTEKNGAVSNRAWDRDGYYKIYQLTHHGDSRGNDFYSTMLCVALEASMVPTAALFQETTENTEAT